MTQPVNPTHPAAAAQSKTSPLLPGLYLVATPIGNLRDISLRALDTLAACDEILAEDTRRAAKLLSAYNIKASLSPYHDHNEAKRTPALLKKLHAGASIALISDAGTPLVSDPGYRLVSAAAREGLPIVAIPGASALLAAVTTAGLPSAQFFFAGFLPPKSSARKRALAKLASIDASLVFYETAPRLAAALADMAQIFGGRECVIARELTKKFEEIIRGPLPELAAQMSGKTVKGEIVIVIGPPAAPRNWSEQELKAGLRPLIATIGVKRAAAAIAEESNSKARDIYALALAMKQIENDQE